MSTSLISQYTQRCDLNLEAFATMNYIWKFAKNPEATLRRFQLNNSGIFIVSTSYLSTQYQSQGGEWIGFVNTLKHWIHKEVDHMKNMTAREIEKINADQIEVQKSVDSTYDLRQ